MFWATAPFYSESNMSMLIVRIDFLVQIMTFFFFSLITEAIQLVSLLKYFQWSIQRKHKQTVLAFIVIIINNNLI